MLAASILTLVRKSTNKNYANFVAQQVFLQIRRSKFKSSNRLRVLNKKFDQMIRVKFNDEENRVLISLRCKLLNSCNDEGQTEGSLAAALVERDFNLNRSQDEEIGATFEKLYANFQKFAGQKINKLAKKQKTLKESKNPELIFFNCSLFLI